MNNFFIYTAGGMSNLTFEEQKEWRHDLKHYLENEIDSKFYKVHVINPVEYYNFELKRHDSELEVMKFDLGKVKTSDMIIVNFNDPKSLGTMAELAVAYEYDIPIIGLNESNHILHPWQIEFCNKILYSRSELLNYVATFYLN